MLLDNQFHIPERKKNRSFREREGKGRGKKEEGRKDRGRREGSGRTKEKRRRKGKGRERGSHGRGMLFIYKRTPQQSIVLGSDIESPQYGGKWQQW